MRIIVYGLGAIGGCVAGLLARSGTDVVGIARGAMLEAVKADGLWLKGHELDESVPLTVVGNPSEIDFRDGDMILMCMKAQHMAGALEDLRAAGAGDQPLFCLQNGVVNEDMALRLFPKVHGVMVWMPATYLEPGRVLSFASPKFGVFETGLFPGGADHDDEDFVRAIDAAGMAGFTHPNVMAAKYGKLLMNLENILNAAMGPNAEKGPLPDLMRTEALAVLDSAGIVWEDRAKLVPERRDLARISDLPGEARSGSSSAQSLLRGTGSIETDYLNGEITRLGRLYGVPTPANAAMQRIGARMVRDALRPGDLTLSDLVAEVGTTD
ncbi:ketopantoate reductase family protein [Sagittula stellata]|uniref:2-dehydropantoate 2-reductase n=1 Tax=Sagittula stellata (strain ATCC 700073 / DSM 11524 / E-37) TaxID=388399 RepID=A3KAZ9_SAGS3|nr:2-dehydropantoate 2-reductase N-terminal domain-containing protein [Sagittula stellata]EBA05668.1 Ketopantoate reductase ApbA/PanE-like protein [Sagittula stellata E-37]